MRCTRPITLKEKPNLLLRCRKCLSCQIAKRKEWAFRCLKEAEEYKSNSFLTLTYSEENKPYNGLDRRDLTLFIKRLRKKLSPRKIKYMACGEYGDNTDRPHYHLILFGYDFPDKEYLKTTKKGEIIYFSKELDELWGLGLSSIGSVTYASASYVAGYVHKKFNSTLEEEIKHYTCPVTGVIKTKEFIASSQGIGLRYLERYKKQLINLDFVSNGSTKQGLPEYFNNRLRNECEETYKKLKYRRSNSNFKKLDYYEIEALEHNLERKFTER